MALIQTICPNCQKGTLVDETLDSCYCLYCGHRLIYQGNGRVKVDYSDVIKNLKSLCEKDNDMHNYGDLNDHSDKIIEKETEDYLGWYYKGLAAAGQRRFRDAYGYWTHCVQLCDDKGFLVKVYDAIPVAVARSLNSKELATFEEVSVIAEYRELINAFKKRGVNPDNLYAIPFVLIDEICRAFSDVTSMRRLYTYYLALAIVSQDVVSNYANLDVVSDTLSTLWKMSVKVLNSYAKYDDYEDFMPKSIELFGTFCKDAFDRLDKCSEDDTELHTKLGQVWCNVDFLPYAEFYERALNTAFGYGPRNNRGKDGSSFMRTQAKSFIRRYTEPIQ